MTVRQRMYISDRQFYPSWFRNFPMIDMDMWCVTDMWSSTKFKELAFKFPDNDLTSAMYFFANHPQNCLKCIIEIIYSI